MKMVRMIAAVAAVTMVATPVLAASLNSKDRARIARAYPRDRDDVRYLCSIRVFSSGWAVCFRRSNS